MRYSRPVRVTRPAGPPQLRPHRLNLSPVVSPALLRILLALAVGVGALIVRWPRLMLIPALTDETGEVAWAYRIAQGELLPLTNKDTYIGAVYPYLLAGLMRLFGPSALLPRATMAVLGALLAALVAWLAWGMARRVLAHGPGPNLLALAVGSVVAGGLTATSFPLVVVTSHVAWSNGLTPLFTTIALGLTWAAVAGADARAAQQGLLAAGAAWGLALQTHPAALAPLLGCAAWLVLHRAGRRRLWSLGGLGALAAFVLAYGNMLWFNLLGRGASLGEALQPQNTYTALPNPATYLIGLGRVLLESARMLAGAYGPLMEGDRAALTPAVPLYAVLALLALLWAARRSATALLATTTLMTLLVPPAVSPDFDGLFDTRYLAPLLPPVYLALGLAATAAWLRTGSRGRLVLAVAALAIVLAPLGAVGGFYRQSEARQLTNWPSLHIAAEARTHAAAGHLVLIDQSLDQSAVPATEDLPRDLEHLLILDGVPHLIAPPPTINWYLANSDKPMLLLLTSTTAADLRTRHPLVPLPLAGPGYGLFTAPPP